MLPTLWLGESARGLQPGGDVHKEAVHLLSLQPASIYLISNSYSSTQEKKKKKEKKTKKRKKTKKTKETKENTCTQKLQ